MLTGPKEQLQDFRTNKWKKKIQISENTAISLGNVKEQSQVKTAVETAKVNR